MNKFSVASKKFGLTISLKNTKLMYTPVPGEPYVEPDIFVHRTRLEVMDIFVYLGSVISRNGNLDSETLGEFRKLVQHLASWRKEFSQTEV